MGQIVYRKILIPHDGSQFASEALPHVLAIESGFNSEIILVQIVESWLQINARLDPIPLFAAGFSTSELALQMQEAETKTAEHNLNQLKQELESCGISQIKTLVLSGIPGDEIVKTAKNEGCDLILMSTHGRSGLGRVFIGSVADQIIRQAGCPVLLVHPKGDFNE